MKKPKKKIKLERGIFYKIEEGVYIGVERKGRLCVFIQKVRAILDLHKSYIANPNFY